MKKIPLFLILFVLFPLSFLTGTERRSLPYSQVTLDFSMAERSIEWLEEVAQNQPIPLLKEKFRRDVLPTEGYRAISLHYSQIDPYKREEFFHFVLKALGKEADPNRVVPENARIAWQDALRNLPRLRQDLAELKTLNLKGKAMIWALEYLPPGARLKSRLHIVAYGLFRGFTVNGHNGFDLLQLPRRSDGSLDAAGILRSFAHSLHHTGLDYLCSKYMKNSAFSQKTILPYGLVAEGMTSFFIDQLDRRYATLRGSNLLSLREAAAEWERNLSRTQELFRMAEADIRLNLAGGLSPVLFSSRWLNGTKGPLYYLGYVMIELIDRELGRETVLSLANDYRPLLRLYNQAARKAKKRGENVFLFDNGLADALCSSKN